MIETYLSTRKALKGVVVILDIRRTPRQEELNLLSWLQHYSIAGILVLTKTDKLSKNKQAQKHNLIAQLLEIEKDDFILFSAKSRRGRDALWKAILSLVDIGDSQAID
jgi:GTP-binding protein